MGFERGERQAKRTKKALVQAFSQLLHDKNYNDITVNDITNLADAGRSTFYRYFKSKADVLVEMHEGIFGRFILNHSSASDWLSDEPSSELVEFFRKFQKSGPVQLSLTYTLGSDIDYLTREIINLLNEKIEESLHSCFSESDSNIPFAVLAQAISGTYSQVLLSWVSKHQVLSVEKIAEYIHRITRSVIQEAIGQS